MKLLVKEGSFPVQFTPERMIGEGATIEMRAGEIWLHEQHEIGVGRFSEIESRRPRSVDDAVREFIRAIGGSPIDGVSVDWSG